MERLQQAVTRLSAGLARPRSGVRGPAAALLPLALLLVLGTGCSVEKEWMRFTPEDTPPTGDVVRVAAWWQTQVQYAADPTHGGQMTPGIAGRVYLFGDPRENTFPLKGDSGLVVDLYNDSVPGAPPVHMEEWRIDKETAQRLLRRDMIGWGYTVFLPWMSYRPDITHIEMKVCYDRKPDKGGALFTENQQVTLNPGQGVQVASSTTVLGAGANQAPAAPAQAPVSAAPNGQPAMAPAPQNNGLMPGMNYTITAPGQRPAPGYPANGTGVVPAVGMQTSGPGVVPAGYPGAMPPQQPAPVYQGNNAAPMSPVPYGNTGMMMPGAAGASPGFVPQAAAPAPMPSVPAMSYPAQPMPQAGYPSQMQSNSVRVWNPPNAMGQ